MTLRHGIEVNRSQFIHPLIQVLLVGLTIGLSEFSGCFGIALAGKDRTSGACESVAQAWPCSYPDWRGSAIGIYRGWRDPGYGVGALGPGLVAYYTGQMEAAIGVALSMLASGTLLGWLGEETHPDLNPAPSAAQTGGSQ